MVSAKFLIQNSLGRVRFFEETFLLVDIHMEVVLGMLFPSLDYTDFLFNAREFNWRSYIVARALFTTWQVELIDKHEFSRTALDESSKTFVVHVVALNNLKLATHLSQAPLLAALK